MLELISVASITLLAVISPGADFAMITRNSLLYGRAAGLFSALGIACGVQLHVLYTMIGVGVLIAHTPSLFLMIKLLGAIYLVYIGWQTFFSTPTVQAQAQTESNLSPYQAFKHGFLTNALNPKTTLFVLSVYTQVVHPATSLLVQFGYGLFMSLAHGLWFSLVSLFLSEPVLRERLLRKQVMINRCIGLALFGLGAWLLRST